MDINDVKNTFVKDVFPVFTKQGWEKYFKPAFTKEGFNRHFAEVVKTMYTNIDFKGRTSRSQYWYFSLYYLILAIAAGILDGILFFFPVHNPVAFIVINGICYLGASGMQVLIWAMVNDAIDYHELQTGERNEGIVYSTYSFFRKLASAISGSLSSFVLGAIGYNVTAGAVQTAGVVNAIWKSYTGVYFLGYGIAVAILFFVYPLTKQKTAEMLTELKARRAAKESK